VPIELTLPPRLSLILHHFAAFVTGVGEDQVFAPLAPDRDQGFIRAETMPNAHFSLKSR